jgi:hypothetical protein
MARLLAIVLILGGLVAFLSVYTEGVDGALARFSRGAPSRPSAPAQPVPRRTVSEAMEREGRSFQPIGQRVRERVGRAMEEGARRHGGGD